MASRGRTNSRRKNRLAHDSDDEDAPVAIKASSKQSAGARVAPRAASKISFGDDVQEAVTVKKKKKKPKALSIPGSAADEPEERVNAYSTEAMQQLKLSTPQMPAAFASNGSARAHSDAAGATLVVPRSVSHAAPRCVDS